MQKGFALLRRPPAVLSEDDEARLDALYANMPAGHTIKRTYRKRFTLLDDALIEEIKTRFTSPLSVHDMAASSAVTSMELYRRLVSMPSVQPVTLIASDYYDSAFIAGPRILNSDGKPLKRDLLALLATLAHRLGLSRRISLFHPTARALAKSDPHFRLAKEDLFNPGPAQYHVVRVMNALTEFNFSVPDVEKALPAILQTVRDGGLFILGWSDAEDIHASIFAKESGIFRVVRQFGLKYHFADKVTRYQPVVMS